MPSTINYTPASRNINSYQQLNNSNPQIIGRNQVVKGVTAIFYLDTDYDNSIHHYWLLDGSSNMDKQSTNKKKFTVKTAQLTAGFYRIRLIVSDKYHQRKYRELFFKVTEKNISSDDSPKIISSHESVFSGKDINFHIDSNGLDIVHYYWRFEQDIRHAPRLNTFLLNTDRLKAKNHQIIASVTVKGARKPIKLTYKFTIKEEVSNHEQEEAFLKRLAGNFVKSRGYDQDGVHNELIKYLIKEKFSHQPSHAEKIAFNAVKKYVSNPLYLIRKPSDVEKLSNSDFFVRDFLQCQGKGGTKKKPLVIGKSSSNPRYRKGLHIRDKILSSHFVDNFNSLIEKINAFDNVEKMTRPIFNFRDVAHRDGIQLVPISTRSSQFYGEVMKHVVISGNTIESQGRLQGIFSSDGAFQDLQVTNNSIETEGAHTITVFGMLRGKIAGNTDLSGELLNPEKIKLYPLRLGGGENIQVMSFHNPQGLQSGDSDYYDYEAIDGQPVDDRRFTARHNATLWENVSLPLLHQSFASSAAKIKKIRKSSLSTSEKKIETNLVWEALKYTVCY